MEPTHSRISEIETPGDDPILKELYAREEETFGFVLNTTKVQAHRPEILRAAKQLGAAVARSGLLGPALLALVNLRVALINGCPF
jgi:alkylhydroperoxidase family enzyme